MTRVLVWGMTNSLAGTEAVITNIVKSVGEGIVFDYLTFEELTRYPEITIKSQTFVLPNKRTSYLQYKRAIGAVFRKHAAEYDAVWSNLNILNNIDALRLGAKYGIPRRILHMHNAGNDGKLHQKILAQANRRVINRYVTDWWACSKEAASYSFAGDQAYTFIPNAIEFDKYRFSESARIETRGELGLGDALVIGSVGRLVEQKNHRFLLDVMARLRKRRSAKLVLVGFGPLMRELRSEAERLGIEDSVIFAGEREDIPNLLSAFDVFVMPSLFEGLPVSLLEAQASGLPCLVSDAVSSEAIISSGVTRLPIDDCSSWLAAIEKGDFERVDPDKKRSAAFDLASQATIMKALFENA